MAVETDELNQKPMGDGPLPEGIEEPGEAKSKVEENESFKDLYEESLHEVQEGEVIKGTVIHIGPEFVTVDIGFKSEGQVALREFHNREGVPVVSIGDLIDVLIERKESEVGMVTLSKEKADKYKFWEEISRAWNEDQVRNAAPAAGAAGAHGVLTEPGVEHREDGRPLAVRDVVDCGTAVAHGCLHGCVQSVHRHSADRDVAHRAEDLYEFVGRRSAE